MPQDAGVAAVLRPAQREAFPGALPWSLELGGTAAARRAAAVRLQRPRFVLSTVDQVEVRPGRVCLSGTCAPILLDAPKPAGPLV